MISLSTGSGMCFKTEVRILLCVWNSKGNNEVSELQIYLEILNEKQLKVMDSSKYGLLQPDELRDDIHSNSEAYGKDCSYFFQWEWSAS